MHPTTAPLTLIRDALLINEGQRQHADVLIRNGRIERIAAEISAPPEARVYAAGGRYLLPGMIDDQVHFREPGLEHKGDIASESVAAVAGGITSFMEMPNTQPPTVTLDALRDKYQRAHRRAAANYAFYLGATNDNIAEIRALDPNTAAGIKVFMGASTGNMLVDREETLELIFRDAPCIITTHCEDTPRIQKNLHAVRKELGDQLPATIHPRIRDAEACYLSSSMAVELARRHEADLHVLHLTTAREMALFQPGPVQDKRITAEACVHHLYFCDEDYATLGNLIKCNPAIKSAADRSALIQALDQGRLDIIATDHAPHSWTEKSTQDYLMAAAGLPLVQHALSLALELVHDGHLSLEQIVEKTSHNVARRFQVSDRGFLREGYWADLVLVDLQQPQQVTAQSLLYRCHWSPLNGRTLRSSIAATWVNGHQVWDGEKVLDNTAGTALEFFRSR